MLSVNRIWWGKSSLVICVACRTWQAANKSCLYPLPMLLFQIDYTGVEQSSPCFICTQSSSLNQSCKCIVPFTLRESFEVNWWSAYKHERLILSKLHLIYSWVFLVTALFGVIYKSAYERNTQTLAFIHYSVAINRPEMCGAMQGYITAPRKLCWFPLGPPVSSQLLKNIAMWRLA